MGDRRKSYTTNYTQNRNRRQNVVRLRDHPDNQDQQKNGVDFVATQRCPSSVMRVKTTIEKLVIQNVYHGDSEASSKMEDIDDSQDESDSNDHSDLYSAEDEGQQTEAGANKDEDNQKTVNPEEQGSGNYPDGQDRTRHTRLGSLEAAPFHDTRPVYDGFALTYPASVENNPVPDTHPFRDESILTRPESVETKPFPETHLVSPTAIEGNVNNPTVQDSSCTWLRPLESEHLEERE
ncbi:hypothetical protein EV356DRAFT_46297 [Viridothelium virens]|uniref:Uncharacterized protein n=1 Tax=Viridothelium virens TaxID=1048519 RepID=A0A6A6GT57_VIRVR|nr:hypothetical protein EV356DRAFT_46297 [Viridothelium virens]